MKNKVTVIGAGFVGSTIAYSLIIRDIAEEIAIIDINETLAESQVMDMQHAVPFVGQTDIKLGNYDDCIDSSVVVIACGVAQKPGQTRLDLINKNTQILREILPQIFEKNPDTILVIVTNPVDILTRVAVSMFPGRKNQIMGTGTLLDSARFKHLIGQKLNINPKSIHAYILGEHGDSEFPFWSSATIGSMQLNTCHGLTDADKKDIFEKARNAAYTIIEGKQSTYYGIGAGTSHLINTILHNKKTVLPVSHANEILGIENMCLSTPVVIGKKGIMKKICIQLTEEEQNLLNNSASILEKAYQSIT